MRCRQNTPNTTKFSHSLKTTSVLGCKRYKMLGANEMKKRRREEGHDEEEVLIEHITMIYSVHSFS